MTGRRLRALLAAALVAGIASTAGASAATTPSWRSDHVMLVVTAGPHGAEGLETGFTTQITDTGTGPRVALLGLGSSTQGGAIDAVEGGGGPMQLTTTHDAGGLSAELTGPVSTLGRQPVTVQLTAGRLAPRATVVLLEAFGNFRASRVAMPSYKLRRGSVRLRLIQGPGTVVVRVGDRADGGEAVDAGPLAAGAQQHTFSASTDIGGAFMNPSPASPAVMSDTWTAPDGGSGQWNAAVEASTGYPSFSGPRGRWSLQWAGADASALGNPAAFAYVPLHGYWADFRCHQGCNNPGVG
jgi:hypothetical protein